MWVWGRLQYYFLVRVVGSTVLPMSLFILLNESHKVWDGKIFFFFGVEDLCRPWMKHFVPKFMSAICNFDFFFSLLVSFFFVFLFGKLLFW